jgi:hypothetical protein
MTTELADMRAVAALPIFLLLAACDSANEQDMANCHVEALRSFSDADGGDADGLDNYEKSCMTAKGYRFSALPYDCGHSDPYRDAACYIRRD